MSLVERASQWLDGAETLVSWLGSGGRTVDQEDAQRRADICNKCPLNVNELRIIEVVGRSIKKQTELKNHLQLRVEGEKSLHLCQACGCALALKIWIPIERIIPEPGLRDRLDTGCWLLREAP